MTGDSHAIQKDGPVISTESNGYYDALNIQHAKKQTNGCAFLSDPNAGHLSGPINGRTWKDVTAGHESIGPNLILLETEVKN